MYINDFYIVDRYKIRFQIQRSSVSPIYKFIVSHILFVYAHMYEYICTFSLSQKFIAPNNVSFINFCTVIISSNQFFDWINIFADHQLSTGILIIALIDQTCTFLYTYHAYNVLVKYQNICIPIVIICMINKYQLTSSYYYAEFKYCVIHGISQNFFHIFLQRLKCMCVLIQLNNYRC